MVFFTIPRRSQSDARCKPSEWVLSYQCLSFCALWSPRIKPPVGLKNLREVRWWDDTRIGAIGFPPKIVLTLPTAPDLPHLQQRYKSLGGVLQHKFLYLSYLTSG